MVCFMSALSILSMISTNLIFSFSPMKILSFILLLVWSSSFSLLESGKEFWIPIFSIMLFNGGLMILFLFIITMIPKKKEENSSENFSPLIFIFILSFMFFGKEQSFISNFFFQNLILILSSISLMMIYFFSISKLMIDPLKTVKSF